MKESEYVIGGCPERGKIKKWKSMEDAVTRGAVMPKVVVADNILTAKQMYREQITEDIYGE